MPSLKSNRRGIQGRRRWWDLSIGQNAAMSYVLGFDGINDRINCGSNVTLDDLPGGEFTMDMYLRSDGGGGASQTIVDKGLFSGVGWIIYKTATNVYRFEIAGVGSVDTNTTPGEDGNWHHLATYWNNGGGADRKMYIAIDGIWAPASGLLAGASVADAAKNLVWFTREDSNNWQFKGVGAWMRLSDNDRFGHLANFAGSLPSRCTKPEADGNTIELWKLDDGTGATAAASVNTPPNDGSIVGATWAGCS